MRIRIKFSGIGRITGFELWSSPFAKKKKLWLMHCLIPWIHRSSSDNPLAVPRAEALPWLGKKLNPYLIVQVMVRGVAPIIPTPTFTFCFPFIFTFSFYKDNANRNSRNPYMYDRWTLVQVMVQGVADTYDTYRTRAWDDKPRVNTLVIIGRSSVIGFCQLECTWTFDDTF